MDDSERGGSRWRRWAVRLAALLVLVVVVAGLIALAIHTGPARNYALERAIGALESAGIRLQADALEYNVFGLHATLRGVRLAAAHRPQQPFLLAERVSLALNDLRGARRVVEGQGFRLYPEDRIEIEGGRLQIVRGADGRLNLPGGGESNGDPQPLQLGEIAAPGFAIEFSDPADQLSLTLPATDITLRGDEGRVDLREPGRFARAGTATTVRTLNGAFGFDGQTLALKSFDVGVDEAALTLDGEIDAIASEPRVNVRVNGRGDIARLARWADIADPPHGQVQITGTVTGPFEHVIADVEAHIPELHWQDITATRVASMMRMTPDRIDLRQFDAEMFSGKVSGAASVPFGDAATHIDVSWADLDVERLMRRFAPDLRPRPTGRATGALAGRGVGTDVNQWTLEMRTRTSGGVTAPSRIGPAGLIVLSLERGRWRMRADERVGEVAMHAALRGAVNANHFERSTLTGTITIPPVDTGAVLDLLRRTGVAEIDMTPVEGAVRSEIAVAGTLGRPSIVARGDARIADVAPLAPDTPLGGPIDIEFEATLREARLRGVLHDFNATADGTILLQSPYQATFDIAAPLLDLARALRGIDTQLPLTGAVSATARVSGPLEAWRRGHAAIEVRSLDATAGALPLRLAAPARVEYANETVNVASLEVLAGDTRLSASGALPVADGDATSALLFTATGDLAQFTSAVAATGLVELPDVSGTGPAALLARVTGSFERPHIAADLELGPGTIRSGDLPPATDVHVRAHSDGEWLDLRELRATWQGSRIEASGRAPVAWVRSADAAATQPGRPQSTVTARLSGVTPQVLAPFVDPDTLAQIDGSLDASLVLQSDAPELARVTGSVQLDRMDLRLADLPIEQRVPTLITLQNGFARVAAWEWTGQGGVVSVRGQVNLVDRQAALVGTGRFDLRMLNPFVRQAGVTTLGTVEPRLSITGALEDLRVDGDVTVRSAELRLGDPRIVATSLAARAVVTRTTARLTELAGTVNGGLLSGTGSVAFAPRTPLEAAFNLTVERMGLEFPEGLRSELNSMLGISIIVPAADIVEPSGSITGTVTVLRSGYRDPIAVVGGLLDALRTRQLAASIAADEPSLVDNLTLDIRVLTEEDVVVDNNLGRLQLGADVRLIGTVAAPSVAGRAQLREGGRLFLGRNTYEIESGTIDFANPDTIEPDLDIQARTRAGGENIVLTLKGTPDNLETELSAPDSLEALGEADLYSLLLTGRRLNEISGEEAEIVGEQVLGYVSGDVLGFAGRAVGLDTIRLGGVDEDVLRRDPTAVATEVDPTTRLVFGKSLGPDFDVTYSQSLRDADAQAWILDYRPWRSVETRFVSDEETLRSYEIRHDVSIGGAPLGATSERREAAAERRELPVRGITVTGSGAISEERVRSTLELESGDTFDFGEWQSDRERLEALFQREGYYEARIDAARHESAEGVALTYTIAPGPRGRIDASGARLSGESLERIQVAWSQSVVDEFLLDEVQEIVASDLARDGYVSPKVVVSFRRVPEVTSDTERGVRLQAAGQAEEKVLSIAIEAGPRVTSNAINLKMQDAALAEELHDVIRERRLARLVATEAAAIERDLTALLRGRGYLQARVTAGTLVVENQRATLPVEIEPGRLFTVAQVTFEGAARVPSETLLAESRLAPGAPFDPAGVETARDRIVALYRREGFARARVTVRQAPREESAGVAIAFAIDEGPRQVLAEIEIEQSRGVDRDVITRALDLETNQPLASDAWLHARRRVFDTGLFRRVDVTAEPLTEAAPDAETQPMRVRVTVQPWPALRLRYGFQVAEERPEGEVEGRELVPGLSADITRRTLFGRAVTVGAAIDYERREQSGRAFVSAPTMFGWPVESLAVVDRSRQTFTAETRLTDTSGLSLEQRFRLVPNLRLSYAYRLTRDHTFDTDPDPNFPAFDLTVTVARLNASAAFDTRDDPVDTTRGMLLSSSFDYAPASLGTEFRYVKNLVQAYYFRSWRSVVLASAARVGLAGALDEQQLLLSERFTAGGAHSVRGAEEDGLGPRDFFGPTGGEAVIVLNQEVRFPIYRWVRGVTFLDGGNVFERRSEISLGELVGSYGFGLRLQTPFALLRVDYGRLFSPGPDGRSGRWIFGIGQAF
jgi:outer membrane protein assembly factor BamA/autotransporter translocation and assembly factor TamB